MALSYSPSDTNFSSEMTSLDACFTTQKDILSSLAGTVSDNTVTGLPDTYGLAVGMQVVGANIPTGTTITAINNQSEITLSKSVPTPGTVILSFGNPISPVKGCPTALNINTAPWQVIAAALAGVPTNTDNIMFADDINFPGRLDNLAKRIVSKRPFLCRMDFEDFLAAHIKGNIANSPPYGSGGQPDNIPDDQSPFNSAPPDLTTPSKGYFVSYIYFALDYRWGSQVLAAMAPPPPATPTVPIQLGSPELSLQEYLEIPSTMILPQPYADTSLPAPGNTPNYPAYQKKRFLFFYTDYLGDLATRENASITPKEFNNLINSISTSDSTLIKQAITPYTFPRYSYYSYSDDVDSAVSFWYTHVDSENTSPPLPSLIDFTSGQSTPLTYNGVQTTVGAVETTYAINQMKLYYRIPISTSGNTTTRTDATISNLISWRCKLPSPNSGFYQMSFDDWTSPLNNTHTPYGYGPMQCCGPTNPYPYLKYSTAQFTSGVPGAMGDVSWSPQFAFRSRFYHIFVLGRSLERQSSSSGYVTNMTGEKWLEAVYDGLTDQILWERPQVSSARVQALEASVPVP
jgi:hypothetical protein